MSVNHQLPFIGDLFERSYFKVTVLMFIQIIENRSLKNEKTAIDQTALPFQGFLPKRKNLIPPNFEFSES